MCLFCNNIHFIMWWDIFILKVLLNLDFEMVTKFFEKAIQSLASQLFWIRSACVENRGNQVIPLRVLTNILCAVIIFAIWWLYSSKRIFFTVTYPSVNISIGHCHLTLVSRDHVPSAVSDRDSFLCLYHHHHQFVIIIVIVIIIIINSIILLSFIPHANSSLRSKPNFNLLSSFPLATTNFHRYLAIVPYKTATLS